MALSLLAFALLAACAGPQAVPRSDAESASAGFSATGTTCSTLTAVAADTQPTAVGDGLAGETDCFVYEFRNTSAARRIGSVFVQIPCCLGELVDFSWDLVPPLSKTITLSGSGSAGCAVNTARTATFSPTNKNGQIEVDGCSLAPGQVLDVQFELANPQCTDNWDFPSFLEGSDGIATSQTWPNDQVLLGTGCFTGPTPAPKRTSPVQSGDSWWRQGDSNS